MKYTVLARDANGCSAQDDIIVKVFTRADIYVADSFPPNGDGKNDLALAFLVGIRGSGIFSLQPLGRTGVYNPRCIAWMEWNLERNRAVEVIPYVWQAEGVRLPRECDLPEGVVTLIR